MASQPFAQWLRYLAVLAFGIGLAGGPLATASAQEPTEVVRFSLGTEPPATISVCVGQKKMIKWLTDIVAGDQEPAIRAAAARALGHLGAPPKKEKKD